VGARDGLEKGEPDVPGPQTSRELDLAEGPADKAPALPPDEPSSRGEAYAELRQRVEGGWEPRTFEAPRTELGRFDPEWAALPQISLEAATDYVAQHWTERPWLTAGDAASPEARRILVAADIGGSHGHIRHEGWVTEEASMRRVAYREDPAQLDLDKRYQGIDGLRPGDRPHRCGNIATRVTDPDAFATAFARGAEHPKVRAALDIPFDADVWPGPVTVPIAELLGATGHQYCTGWRLEQVGDNTDTARENRAAWLRARREGREPDVPEPKVRPVPTFEGGDMLFVVGQNRTRDGYEIGTMHPEPPSFGH
jgi:hypothetical protein